MNNLDSRNVLLRNRHAHTIFCDDIRHESSGKLIIVGMYGPELTVPSLPTSLPDMRLMVTFSTPEEQPFKSAEIRVSFRDEVLMTMELDVALSESPVERPSSEEIGHGVMLVHQMAAFLTLQSLNVEKAGNILVRVHTESGVIPAGALYVSAENSRN